MILRTDEVEFLRQMAIDNLVHEYRLVQTVLSAEDDYGEKTRTEGASSVHRAHVKGEGVRELGDLGVVLRDDPEMLVLASDPIAPGDRVYDVTDTYTGRVIDAGPFEVRHRYVMKGYVDVLCTVHLERVGRGANATL